MKVSYANMKLKTNTSVNTFDFCEQKIEVLKYLPAQDKYDLLMITLQKSLEGNVYNAFKLNLYFELNLVYMYTNISFTDKQREDEFKLYDTLKSNGFFELFYSAMEVSEYEDLFKQMTDMVETFEKDRGTVAGILTNFIDNLPEQADTMANILNNFDPALFKDVIDFARYANGGRDINTNEPVETPIPKIVQKADK